MGQIDLRTGTVGLGQFSRSILVVGHKSSSGAAAMNAPQVINGDSDIDAFLGPDCDLAEDCRAIFSVPGVKGVAQVSALPVPEPTGGVRATFPFEFVPPPSSGALGTATTATAAHQLEIMVGAQRHFVAVLAGDTMGTIAGAAVTVLNANRRLLYTASRTGRTIWIGTGNARFSFTALDAGQSVVITQKVGNTQAEDATYANGLLTINLGTDGGGAADTTGSQVKTLLDGVAGLSGKIAYNFGGDGSGIMGAVAQFALPYATVTLTAKHPGQTGNGVALRFRMSTDGGVRVAVGTVYFDGTTPNAASSYSLVVGAQTHTATLGNSRTSTQAAGDVRDMLNAGGFAVSAASTNNLLMLYAVHGLDQTDGRDVRRMSITGTSVSPQTVTAAFGTAGSGSVDITTALGVMEGQKAHLVWITRLRDATTLTALKNHLDTFTGPLYQKPQILVFDSWEAPTAMAATHSSAGLTTSPWTYDLSLPEAATPQGVLAARFAGMIVKEDYAAKSFAKAKIPTSGSLLLPVPAPQVRQKPADKNTSLYSLGLTPLEVDAAGDIRLSFPQNTIPLSTAEDERTCLLAVVLAVLKVRDIINTRLHNFLFNDEGGKSIREYGIAHTPDVTTLDALQQEIKLAMLSADAQDLIQVIDADLEEIRCVPEPGKPTIVNFSVGVRPVAPLRIANYRQNLV